MRAQPPADSRSLNFLTRQRLSVLVGGWGRVGLRAALVGFCVYNKGGFWVELRTRLRRAPCEKAFYLK